MTTKTTTMTPAERKRQQQAVQARMAAAPAYYRQHLLIEVSGRAVRYADVAAEWQERDYRAMDAAWLRCVGLTTGDVMPMRSWQERNRGAAKTSGLSLMACWGLRFAPRRVKFNWYAGDTDQARLGIKAIQANCELNPWLGLEVQRNLVRNPQTGSELEILSSDAATGYGQLCDAILVDEIGNWPDTTSAQNLWHMIASTLAKKQNCLCLCITNAGCLDSWQWKVREAIREDPNWYFHALDKVPEWITADQLSEQRRLLPASVYARLWENQWSSGNGDGLDAGDIAAAMKLDGPQPFREDRLYAIGLDLGLRKDRAACTVLAADPMREVVELAHTESWRPSDFGGEIDLSVVERKLIALCGYFRVGWLIYDPWQAALMAQRLRRQGINAEERAFTPKRKDIMAKALLEATRNRLLHLYPDAELVRDLHRLVIREGPLGFRLDAARNADGHVDKGISLSVALPEALYIARNYMHQQPTGPQWVVA